MMNPVTANTFNQEVYAVPPLTTVVIDRQWTLLSEEERALLTKILGSVKLPLSAVRILAAESISIKELESSGALRVISFGTKIAECPLPYLVTEVSGIPVITAHSLPELDDQRKKSLWQGLRSMFGL